MRRGALEITISGSRRVSLAVGTRLSDSDSDRLPKSRGALEIHDFSETEAALGVAVATLGQISDSDGRDGF